MKAAVAIVSATLRQLVGVRRLILFGLLALFPALVLFLVMSEQGRAGGLEPLVDGALFHFFLAVPVTTLILAAAALGEERRDETLSFIVLRPIPRSLIAGSKLGAAFLAAAGLNATGAIAITVVYGIRADSFDFVLPLLVGSLVATVVYTSVFVPLGYLSERSTLIGLAYVFIWENGIIGAIQVLGVTSPWRIGFTTFAALAPDQIRRFADDFAVADLTLSAGTSLVQSAVFLGLSATLLTWILRRRDLV